MTTLHLTLKKEWFDQISAGRKTEEYREAKPYWIARLMANGIENRTRHFDQIVFKNGYSSIARTMTVECLGIELHKQLTTPLGHGPCFVIKLGKIL
jgi:hypothetical protein